MTGDTTKNLPDGDDRIGKLIDMVQTMSASLEDVKTDVQDVKTDLQDVKVDLHGVKADLHDAKSDLHNLKSDLRNVKTDLQDVKVDLHDVKTRLSTLEHTVSERLYDTRPIWERALAEIAETRSEMREGFHKLGDKMEVLNEDVLTVRAEHRRLTKRIDNLEPKTP